MKPTHPLFFFLHLLALPVHSQTLVEPHAPQFTNVHHANEPGLRHPITDPIFAGPVGPDGSHMAFTGHIQSVHEQIKAANPDFKLSQAHHNETARKELAARAWTRTGIHCKSPSPPTWGTTNPLYDGIQHLDGIPLQVKCPGLTCCRISCSWSTGIWWCNDRQEADYQDAWWLASFAQDIVNRCSRASIEAGLQTWGQETDSWGFAVIAGHLGYC